MCKYNYKFILLMVSKYCNNILCLNMFLQCILLTNSIEYIEYSKLLFIKLNNTRGCVVHVIHQYVCILLRPWPSCRCYWLKDCYNLCQAIRYMYDWDHITPFDGSTIFYTKTKQYCYVQ